MSDLPAGRELDALVAEKVMGWTMLASCPMHISGCSTAGIAPGQQYSSHVPDYSTSIEAAWQVVGKITALDSTHIFVLRRFYDGWHCAFGAISYEADTAPLAMCRAALQAVEAS